MVFYFLYKYKNNFLFPKIKFVSASSDPGGIPVVGEEVPWVLKPVEGQDHHLAQVNFNG